MDDSLAVCVFQRPRELAAQFEDVAFRQRLLTSAARQARHLAAVLPAGLSGAGLVTAAKGLCMAGLCLPATLASAWIGAHAYGRVGEAAFRLVVLGLLLASGIGLVAQALL